MTNEMIKESVLSIVEKYCITRVVLFGSRASHSNRDDSDVDLMVEFSVPVSLITLASIKYELEDKLNLSVDLIHGPLTEQDIIEVDNEVVLYAA